MRAPTRSHGFEKPSDLEDELAQLDEERADPELNQPSATASARTKATSNTNRTIQQQLDDLRHDMDALRLEVEKLQVGNSGRKRQDSEFAAWMPVIRSVAVTSLAGRIFASSPMIALLVAAVPFALGLTAGSR